MTDLTPQLAQLLSAIGSTAQTHRERRGTGGASRETVLLDLHRRMAELSAAAVTKPGRETNDPLLPGHTLLASRYADMLIALAEYANMESLGAAGAITTKLNQINAEYR